MIFLAKDDKVHTRLGGAKLVNICGCLEVSRVIPKKSVYMNDDIG